MWDISRLCSAADRQTGSVATLGWKATGYPPSSSPSSSDARRDGEVAGSSVSEPPRGRRALRTHPAPHFQPVPAGSHCRLAGVPQCWRLPPSPAGQLSLTLSPAAQLRACWRTDAGRSVQHPVWQSVAHDNMLAAVSISTWSWISPSDSATPCRPKHAAHTHTHISSRRRRGTSLAEVALSPSTPRSRSPHAAHSQ